MSPALADSLPVTRQAVGKQLVVLDRAGLEAADARSTKT
jgi:hypothetical protein